MRTCAMSPRDRRAQVKAVGDDLVKHHGKKHFYTVQQVKDANRRNNIDVDFACWSHAAFNSHSDFDAYHESIGEQCDYAVMKGEMLESVSNTADSSLFDIDLSWLEFPDVNWSIFDFVDF